MAMEIGHNLQGICEVKSYVDTDAEAANTSRVRGLAALAQASHALDIVQSALSIVPAQQSRTVYVFDRFDIKHTLVQDFISVALASSAFWIISIN